MKLVELIQDQRPKKYSFGAYWINAVSGEFIPTQSYEHCAFLLFFPEKFGYTPQEVYQETGLTRKDDNTIDYDWRLMAMANEHKWARVQVSNSYANVLTFNIQSQYLNDIHSVARILTKKYGVPDQIIYDIDIDRFTILDADFSQTIKGKRLKYFLRTGKVPPETLKEEQAPTLTIDDIRLPFQGWINPHKKECIEIGLSEHSHYALWYHESFGITKDEVGTLRNAKANYIPDIIKLMNKRGWVRARCSTPYSDMGFSFNLQSTNLQDIRATLVLVSSKFGLPDVLFYDTEVETYRYLYDQNHTLKGDQIRLFAKTGRIPTLAVVEEVDVAEVSFVGWYNPDSEQAVSIGFDTHAEYVVRHPEKFGLNSELFKNLDIRRVEITNSAPEIDALMFSRGWVRMICDGHNFMIHGDNTKRMYIAFRFAAKKLNIIPIMISLDFQDGNKVKSVTLDGKNVKLYARTGKAPNQAMVEFTTSQKYWINPLLGKLFAVEDHAAFVYSHPRDIGLTDDDLAKLGTQDPKDAEASHRAILAGLRHDWVKCLIRQRQISFEGINLNNIHGALVLFSQEVGIPEKVYLDYYMNGRKVYEIIVGNDIQAFIKTGKIPSKNLYDGINQCV
jgi:hypothetical protein